MEIGNGADRSRRWFEGTAPGWNILSNFLLLGVVLAIKMPAGSSGVRDSLFIVALIVLFGSAGGRLGFPIARLRRDLDDARSEIRDLRAQFAAGGNGGPATERPGS